MKTYPFAMMQLKTTGVLKVIGGMMLIIVAGIVLSGCAIPVTYDRAPYRNNQVNVSTYWQYEYTLTDPNGSYADGCDAYPKELLSDLNKLGAADHNQFVLCTVTTRSACNIRIVIHEYYESESTGNSLMAQVFTSPYGVPDLCISTGDNPDHRVLIQNLAEKIYPWFHTGWHYNAMVPPS